MKLTALYAVVSAGSTVMATPVERQQAGLRWFGANEAGAEFGEANLPGTDGVEYTWPNLDAIDALIADGMNLFRIPFRIERLAPDAVNGSLAEEYLANLVKTVNHITEQGAWAAIDPHNYGRYYDSLLVPKEFQTFWANVASNFVDDEHYNSMPQDLVLKLNQAAIDGIRSAGATSQYIFAEGNAWTGAWTWVDQNDDMKSLTDPEDKIIFEMHQYFNADGSSSQTCVSPTIGEERVASATEWLRTNGKLGVIGEFAGYNNETCKAAVDGMIKFLSQNSDVWTGALWWAAGPWWGNSEYSYEPPSGAAYSVYKPILQPYFPGGSGTNGTRRG
ncbi:glycoside hydrolase family 5 protein [Aspergillus lucknowensis]|uniref:cellulase n=1 Tax=Aspergillus lucknowensis TaxID=176173 RepID=A0ABR4LE18_9EURO